MLRTPTRVRAPPLLLASSVADKCRCYPFLLPDLCINNSVPNTPYLLHYRPAAAGRSPVLLASLTVRLLFAGFAFAGNYLFILTEARGGVISVARLGQQLSQGCDMFAKVRRAAWR